FSLSAISAVKALPSVAPFAPVAVNALFVSANCQLLFCELLRAYSSFHRHHKRTAQIVKTGPTVPCPSLFDPHATRHHNRRKSIREKCVSQSGRDEGLSVKKLFLFAFLLTFALVAQNSAHAVGAGDPNAPVPPPPPPAPDPVSFFKPSFGVVSKASFLGIGGDVGASITPFFNVRGGFNGLSFTQGFTNNG